MLAAAMAFFVSRIIRFCGLDARTSWGPEARASGGAESPHAGRGFSFDFLRIGRVA